MNNIHFPIALEKSTNRLVNVKEVENGLACNCYCENCNEDLIAVNKEVKQRAHFRHSKESGCSFNHTYESYIHWLAKTVIKNLDSIALPPITFNSMSFKQELHERMRDKVRLYLQEFGLMKAYDINEFYFYERVLQPYKEIKIEKCELEKTYKTNEGYIIVDAVVKFSNQELFIEPYFINQIDDIKFEKISTLDISTISIDLMSFVKQHSHYFSIDVFTDYIKNDILGKQWVFIRENKANSLIESIFNLDFQRNVSYLKEDISKNILINEELEKIDKELQVLKLEFNRKTSKLNKKFDILSQEKTRIRFNDLFKNDRYK